MNVAVVAVIVVAVLVVVAIGVVLSRRRRFDAGVDSFRRQIDALSPEARRPVVDQVQSVTVKKEPVDAPTDDSAAETPPADGIDGPAVDAEELPDEQDGGGEDGDRGP